MDTPLYGFRCTKHKTLKATSNIKDSQHGTNLVMPYMDHPPYLVVVTTTTTKTNSTKTTSTMNVAQRRGKGPESIKNQTRLVPEESHYHPPHHEHHDSGCGTTAPTSLPPTTTHNNNTSMIMMNPMNMTTTAATTTTVAAKVRRNYCGTGPFDHKWLNLDCCGLFCALITHLLHLYAIYTVLFILLPPWMNTDRIMTDVVGTDTLSTTTTTTGLNNMTDVARQMMAHRNNNNHPLQQQQQHTMSWMGVFHSLAFTCVAGFAMISHWYAMTTDPGSVPPDAQPILDVTDAHDTTTIKNPSITVATTTTTTTNNNSNDNDVSNNENHTSDTAAKNNGGSSNTTGANSNHPLALQNYLLEPPPSPPPRAAAVKRICRRCKSYKPYRAHHCSICQRCIIKMDHHCPWINNCVGIGNHKYFLLFIFYTSISCLYSLLLIITRFTACSNSINYHDHHFRSHSMKLLRLRHSAATAAEQQMPLSHSEVPHCLDRPAHLLFILALLVEAILFGLFTGCMMMDQMDVVRSKVTHIDRYKGGDDSVGSHSMAGVLEVFGIRPRGHSKTTKIASTKSSRHVLRDGRFRWDWLSPFAPVCFPSHAIRDDVIGFCRPCFPSSSNFTSKKDTIALVPLQSSFAKNVTTTSSKGSKGTNKSSMVEII